jgi:hypothetical protein
MEMVWDLEINGKAVYSIIIHFANSAPYSAVYTLVDGTLTLLGSATLQTF